MGVDIQFFALYNDFDEIFNDFDLKYYGFYEELK